jgi:hypothetical protein
LAKCPDISGDEGLIFYYSFYFFFFFFFSLENFPAAVGRQSLQLLDLSDAPVVLLFGVLLAVGQFFLRLHFRQLEILSDDFRF